MVVALRAGRLLRFDDNARTLQPLAQIEQTEIVSLSAAVGGTLFVVAREDSADLALWRVRADGAPEQMLRARGEDVGGVVTAVVPSPTVEADQTVYVGASSGVFVSRDAGATFQSWNDGLTSRSVVSLTTSSNFVYALALGGTIWRRDALNDAASL